MTRLPSQQSISRQIHWRIIIHSFLITAFLVFFLFNVLIFWMIHHQFRSFTLLILNNFQFLFWLDMIYLFPQQLLLYTVFTHASAFASAWQIVVQIFRYHSLFYLFILNVVDTVVVNRIWDFTLTLIFRCRIWLTWFSWWSRTLATRAWVASAILFWFGFGWNRTTTIFSRSTITRRLLRCPRYLCRPTSFFIFDCINFSSCSLNLCSYCWSFIFLLLISIISLHVWIFFNVRFLIANFLTRYRNNLSIFTILKILCTHFNSFRK